MELLRSKKTLIHQINLHQSSCHITMLHLLLIHLQLHLVPPVVIVHMQRSPQSRYNTQKFLLFAKLLRL